MPPQKVACGEWLATQKLIHDDTPHPGADFPSWEAALSGRGVAIVRRALVSQLIETGQLVQLHPDHRWPLKWSYYVVTPQQSVMRSEVKRFHDWLVQDVIASSAQFRTV